VRDTENWQTVLREQFKYTDSAAVAFQPQSRFLARASGHNVVIHDLHSEATRHTLRAHTANVRDLSWSPDGTQLASAGHDGTVRVWHVPSGQEVLALTGDNGSVHSVAWSPDGQALAAACSDGAVRVWDASRGYRLVEDLTFLDAITSYRRRRGQELTDAGQLKRALPLLSAVLRWRPDDSRLREQRGQIHARLGRWHRAAADFARAAQLAPYRGALHCFEAVTRLRSGDIEGYRRACRRLIERALEQPSDETAAAMAGWMCLFGYEHVRHSPFARQMVDRLRTVTEDKPHVRYGLRLAELRCGRVPPALQKPNDTDSLSESDRTLLRLVESLRLIQLGRRQQAGASYDSCRKAIQSLAGWDTGPKWWKLAHCEILAAEVEAALAD
jgi:hypothetical protein